MFRRVGGASATVAIALLACSSDGASTVSDLGKPCLTQSDCALLICVPKLGQPIGPGAPGVCSIECETGGCLAGWTCLPMSRGRDVCQCVESPEVCDGNDNDCNGVVDDAAGDVCKCEKTVCGDRCVDTTNDREHCGGCGLACGPAQTCESSLCTCADGRDACASGCTDVKTDPKHCGGCGNVCGPGLECVDGTCLCPGPSGEACLLVDQPDRRTFCGLDGRCKTALPILDCTAPTVVSGRSGVGVVCTSSASKIHLVRASSGVTTCGFSTFETLVVTDGDTLLFHTRGGSFGNGDDVVACTATGAVDVANVTSDTIEGLGVGDGNVYWLGQGTLRRCPTTGCSGAPDDVATLTGKTVLAADASGLYAASAVDLSRIDPSTGTFTPLGAVAGITSITIDGDRLWLVTPSAIVSCPKAGCGASATTFYSATAITSFSVDATDAWWRAGDRVFRCAKSAPCVQPGVVLDVANRAFGADDASLYVSNGAKVERIAK